MPHPNEQHDAVAQFYAELSQTWGRRRTAAKRPKPVTIAPVLFRAASPRAPAKPKSPISLKAIIEKTLALLPRAWLLFKRQIMAAVISCAEKAGILTVTVPALAAILKDLGLPKRRSSSGYQYFNDRGSAAPAGA